MAYARMRSDGPENLGGHAYSGTTLQKTHAFLAMMFKKAVDYDYIRAASISAARAASRCA